MLQFSLDLCDPTKTPESLQSLMNFAISLDDKKQARNIELYIPEGSRKRKHSDASIKLPDLDEFYAALMSKKKRSNTDIELVKATFIEQGIQFEDLKDLIETDLKEYGIKQGGLRKSILAVIEQVE